MADFFIPRDSRSVGWSYQALPEKTILSLTALRGNVSNLNEFGKACGDLPMSQDVDYDVSSLSAIRHMGIGTGKGVFTTVNQVLPELVSAGLSPVVNGRAVYLQGSHNETLSVYCVHC